MLEPLAPSENKVHDKAPSLLVLLHHHDTQLSRLQIVPSGALISEHLLYYAPGPLRALANASYTRSQLKALECLGLEWLIARATDNGNESKRQEPLTLTRIKRAQT